MKIKNILFALLACSCLLIISNCKDDDDGNGNGNNGETPSIYEISCCQIPPLVACVGGARIYLPNAFTPSGDGVNDSWFPYGNAGIEIIESLVVKSSDNEIVFEKLNFLPNDASSAWDGKINDSISDDVFTYTITARNVAGESATFDGGVCIRSTIPLECVTNEEKCAFSLQHDGDGRFSQSFSSLENCQ